MCGSIVIERVVEMVMLIEGVLRQTNFRFAHRLEMSVVDMSDN